MSYNESSSSGKAPVSVPRFQQRTSERAHLEGAFQPGNDMDYSSGLSSDPEHVAGSSPWASSSPKQGRDLASQGAAGPQSGTQQYGQVEGGQYSGRPSTSDSTTLAPSENGHVQDSPYHDQDRQPQHAQQQYQYAEQQLPPPAGGEQRRPEAQRYHRPPQQQRPPPQYKLQCKITGLERTGKKDPILKFDAYVCEQARGWAV